MFEFASLSDLVARWPSMQPSDSNAARLRDACALVASEMERSGVAIDQGDEVQSANLKAVVCQMVHRAVGDGGALDGVTNQSRTAGPYTMSYTFANPDGGLYISAAERRLLRMKRLRVGSIRPIEGD